MIFNIHCIFRWNIIKSSPPTCPHFSPHSALCSPYSHKPRLLGCQCRPFSCRLPTSSGRGLLTVASPSTSSALLPAEPRLPRHRLPTGPHSSGSIARLPTWTHSRQHLLAATRPRRFFFDLHSNRHLLGK